MTRLGNRSFDAGGYTSVTATYEALRRNVCVCRWTAKRLRPSVDSETSSSCEPTRELVATVTYTGVSDPGADVLTQPGRPQRRPQRRRLRTDPPAAQPLVVDDETEFEPVEEAGYAPGRPASPAASATIRDRRRTRSHVRDYSYVRVEVRTILVMSFAMIVAIAIIAFAIR